MVYGYDTASTVSVRGTDSDNDGLLIGIDYNRDGDYTDPAGYDECYTEGGLDDRWATFLDSLQFANVSVIFMNCHAGGIINDISHLGAVTTAACTEGQLSYGTSLLDSMVAAFSHTAADVDTNNCISFTEAFDYTCSEPWQRAYAQFDDNGDGVSHQYPLPNGGDGYFGEVLSWGESCDSCLSGCIGGDVDHSCNVEITDLVLLADYIFYGGTAPDPLASADLNDDCAIDMSDLSILIDWLYGTPGDPLVCGCAQ